MLLEATTYSAFRGYSWSSVPACASLRKLTQLYRMISDARGAFPDPLSVEVGFVSDGKIAAAFTIQNVDMWDAERRSSDYAALAFMPVSQAGEIDFVNLLNNDFFWIPSRRPLTSLEYDGPTSATVPYTHIQRLSLQQRCLIDNPHVIGDILAKYGDKSKRWIGLMNSGRILRIECDNWE